MPSGNWKEKETQTLDTFGVPEHYATETGVIEDAGGGNIRVVRCIRRGGILIPVYSAISPITTLIIDSAAVNCAATEIFNRTQMELVGIRRH